MDGLCGALAAEVSRARADDGGDDGGARGDTGGQRAEFVEAVATRDEIMFSSGGRA